ncbi:type II secretion system protein GspD [Endozoicomonas sp. (ex Bugula neritina AB1)]|nr:type II secretion system protein GspD [Endozoicomonas sp. (ex Bugula neritina AB1)]
MKTRVSTVSHATTKLIPYFLALTMNVANAATVRGAIQEQEIKPATNEKMVIPSGKLWTLNQQNADIREFISQIAKITGQTYVIDPRIKGGNTVTVISSKPLSKDEVYDVFLEVLTANGYTVIPKGSIINIVPSTTAKTSSPTGEQKPDGAVMATRVIELHSVSSIEVIPIIRPLIAQYGHAAASASSNAVIVSDLADNVNRITKLVRELDNAGNNDYEVIQLQHAWVGDVAKIISDTLVTGKGQLPSGLQVIADERSNRLVVKGNASKRARVNKLVQTLDREGIRKSTTKVMFLSFADAKNLADILSEASGTIQDSQGKNGNKGSSGSTPAPPSLEGIGQPKGTPTTKSGSKSNFASSSVFVKADESQNALVMIADPETLREMEKIVRQLDVPRAQVLLEAVIVEVGGGIDDALGVQWGIDGTKTIREGVTSGTHDATTHSKSSITGNILNNANIALGQVALRADNFGVLVGALSSQSNSNILSTPSMLTLDNQEAEFLVGKNVPIKTGTQQTNSGNPITTNERKDVGLKLKITPHINEGKSLRLELEQEMSSLDSSASHAASTATDKEIIYTNRTIKTTILVDDGQTVVIGGLIDHKKDGIKKKVPLLGDIPILGLLFQYEADEQSKRNLMLFIRPTIMRDSDALVKATQDRFTKLKLLQTVDQKPDNLPLNPSDLFETEVYDLRNQEKSVWKN